MKDAVYAHICMNERVKLLINILVRITFHVMYHRHHRNMTKLQVGTGSLILTAAQVVKIAELFKDICAAVSTKDPVPTCSLVIYKKKKLEKISQYIIHYKITNSTRNAEGVFNLVGVTHLVFWNKSVPVRNSYLN